MEQQQFHVRFSVGLKLILSMIATLGFIIFALNQKITSILVEDKKTFTLQLQSTESLLLGRELVGATQQNISTLKVALGTIEPEKPLTQQQRLAFNAVLGNQTSLIRIETLLIDKKDQIKSVLGETQKRLAEELKLSDEMLQSPVQELSRVLKGLRERSYAFMNLSPANDAIVGGIALADTSYESPTGVLPVVVGYFSLQHLLRDFQHSLLTISALDGMILFDPRENVMRQQDGMAQDELFKLAVESNAQNSTHEYVEGGVKYLGSYSKPGFDLIVLNRVEYDKAMAAVRKFAETFMILGFLAVAGAVIFIVLFSRTLTRPIRKLFNATKRVSDGEFDIRLKPEYRDEIGALTDSFNIMSGKIVELLEEQKKKAQLENEISIASTVQQTLIPPSSYRDSKLLIESHYQSASSCGGDWWGHFSVGGKTAILIADATGHGIPSALITAAARSCFSLIHKMAQENPGFSWSPGEMLSHANRVIHESSYGQIMMTFFCCVIDFDKNQLTYANGGHNPAWFFKRTQDGYEMSSLTASGQRLGEAYDVPPYSEKTVDISPEDILFLYTDGVMEGKNLEGKMFGKKRVLQIVKDSVQAGPKQIAAALMSEFLRYNQGKALDDDVTLVAVKYMIPGEPE